MLSSRLGRLQFFLYSAAISIAELIAIVLCIVATTGFDGLVRSKPGPSRESLALASFAVMTVFAIARMNIAWRRGHDADLSKWKLVVPYIVAVELFAVLQAAILLVYDFETGTTNGGLNILAIVLIALWWRICLASSKPGTFDPDAFLIEEGGGGSPSGTSRLPTTEGVSAQASMIPVPVNVRAQGPSNATGVVFGKRQQG
jgi:uncharacterized membrane protein YhaH (DUF805 family)